MQVCKLPFGPVYQNKENSTFKKYNEIKFLVMWMLAVSVLIACPNRYQRRHSLKLFENRVANGIKNESHMTTGLSPKPIFLSLDA
jgi:hypothetical protein